MNLQGSADDLTTDFTYNPASQIDERARTNTGYLYDPPANGTTNYDVNGLNRYDDLNPLGAGSIEPVYDDRGNLTQYGNRSFTYDSLNRLTSSTVSGQTTGYNYDPLGRLYFFNPPGTAFDQRFQWDGAQIITAYAGSSGTTIAQRYAHTPGGLGAPDAEFVGSGMTLSDQIYLLTDERGSVIAQANGSDGLVANINSYGPYGEVGSGNAGLFGYTGQLTLNANGVGLVYMRNRVYFPELGRFLQTDPIGYGGGMNLYAYAGNDPVNAADPWGLTEQDVPWRKQHPQSPMGCTGSRACTGRAWSDRPGTTTAYSGGGMGTGGGGGGGGGGSSGGGSSNYSGGAILVTAGHYGASAPSFGTLIDIGLAGSVSGQFSLTSLNQEIDYARLEQIVVTARETRMLGGIPIQWSLQYPLEQHWLVYSGYEIVYIGVLGRVTGEQGESSYYAPRPGYIAIIHSHPTWSQVPPGPADYGEAVPIYGISKAGAWVIDPGSSTYRCLTLRCDN